MTESTTATRPPRRARRITAAVFFVLGALVAVVAAAMTISRYVPFSLAPTTGDRWAFVTAVTDFAVVGYAMAVVLLAVAMIIRFRVARLVVTVVVLALAGLHLSWIVPRYVGGDRAPTSDVRIRILTQNMDRGRADLAQLVAHGNQADIAVLTELTRPSQVALRKAGWRARFPYEQPQQLTYSATGGTRLFSRYPIAGTRRIGGPLNLQIWSVSVSVPGTTGVNVLAVHLGSPELDGDHWLAEQEGVRAATRTSSVSMIVGDFSAVDSQAPMRDLRAAGFRSSAELSGAGWQPTYPAEGSIPPLFAIDHILLGPRLTATESVTLPTAGTDHRAVLATVAPAGG